MLFQARYVVSGVVMGVFGGNGEVTDYRYRQGPPAPGAPRHRQVLRLPVP